MGDWVSGGGFQLILVHGGGDCQWLAGRGCVHLNGVSVSLKVDVNCKFIHRFVREFESEGGDMFDKVDENYENKVGICLKRLMITWTIANM